MIGVGVRQFDRMCALLQRIPPCKKSAFLKKVHTRGFDIKPTKCSLVNQVFPNDVTHDVTYQSKAFTGVRFCFVAFSKFSSQLTFPYQYGESLYKRFVVGGECQPNRICHFIVELDNLIQTEADILLKKSCESQSF